MSEENLEIMQRIDKEHLKHPAKGVVGMTDYLLEDGIKVGTRRVRRLMREMGIEVLERAISKYGVPEIINSDQGRQFSSKEWTAACAAYSDMKVSMDGRGRAKDRSASRRVALGSSKNIWIERFWKTIKYEYIYILPDDTGSELYHGISKFVDDYNHHRRHQGINHMVPGKIYLKEVA
ncbi:MAG: integrase core domain-containing protein [Bacteroidaceae bacterium]|nr:integrase core domain-containing protein [Bacteroidaceae bacterium]